jgi:hypothetical protein
VVAVEMLAIETVSGASIRTYPSQSPNAYQKPWS